MSKIRNSLGLLVLPVPSDVMTWDEYKEHYGIDLNNIFHVYLEGGHSWVDFSKLPSKLFAISGLSPIVGGHNVAVVSGIDIVPMKNVDDEVIGCIVYLAVTGYLETVGNTYVSGRLIMEIFDDPETRNIIQFSEL